MARSTNFINANNPTEQSPIQSSLPFGPGHPPICPASQPGSQKRSLHPAQHRVAWHGMGMAVTGSCLVPLLQALIRTSPTPSFYLTKIPPDHSHLSPLTSEISFPQTSSPTARREPTTTPPSTITLVVGIHLFINYSSTATGPSIVFAVNSIFVAFPGPLT